MSKETYRQTHEKAKAVMHTFSLWEKGLGALQGLKMRFFPRRVLVAGPYVGEFGHELMEWQAWVRALAPRYQEVHVLAYPGRDVLYPGCTVHSHGISLEKAGYKHGRFAPDYLDGIAKSKAAELGLKDYDLLGIRQVCTRHHRRFILRPDFEALAPAERAAPPVFDVAFHFRRVKKEGPDTLRNYPEEQCNRLAELSLQAGLKVCCIGHPSYSYCPEGVQDCRSEDLGESIRTIASSRILVGELSGPSHLAQLCEIPILIWAPDQWRIDNCNRWNVFKVPTFVAGNDTPLPSPEQVMEVLQLAMRRLIKKTIGKS